MILRRLLPGTDAIPQALPLPIMDFQSLIKQDEMQFTFIILQYFCVNYIARIVATKWQQLRRKVSDGLAQLTIQPSVANDNDEKT